MHARWFGLPDPRTYGSKNPGATNVLRSGRKAAAILTLAGDGLKGWLAVALTLGSTLFVWRSDRSPLWGLAAGGLAGAAFL